MGAMLMLEIQESGGLCSTCNNAPTCYHRATRGPALFCEMFDDYVVPAVRLETRPSPEPAMEPRENARFAGLCANCANRHSCMHPRPPGGIWHCEDYE